MIKAVFFDWFDTLAHYEPPRQELYSQTLREFGIQISPRELTPGIAAADKYFLDESMRSPIEKRSPQEQGEVYLRYQGIVLAKSGIQTERELLVKLLKKMQTLLQGLSLVLFDDVLPTLKTLKERNLTLGLLTNASRNILALQSTLGLEPYLDFVVTSQEVGADKPEPPVFLEALRRAAVKPSEAIHVGDHYNVDVIGARQVGIKPILLDRYNSYPDITDCPRIGSLTALSQYLA